MSRLKQIRDDWTGKVSERIWADRGSAANVYRLPRELERLYPRFRAWAEREARPLVEAADVAPHDQHDAQLEILRRAGRAGMLTAMIPKLFGGDGSMRAYRRWGGLQFLPFVEELSAVSPGLATLCGAHYLGLMPLFLSMDIPQARSLLRPLCTRLRRGEPAICAYALTEPGAGSDAEDEEGASHARLGVFARPVKGGYILSGRKCFISGGNFARLITVFAATDRARGVKSWTCLVVTPEMPGFTLGRIEDKLGQRASPAAELVFDDVFVPLRNRVGREGDGWRLNVLTLDTSRPAVGAIATGAARGIMRQLIAWAHEHNLSGDRLLQHDIGDMLARIEAARALVMRAAGTFPARHDLSAMAKSFASDTAMAVASQALDIMGEAGGLRQRCVERLYRDIKLTQIYEGTNQINRLGILEDILLKGLDWERW